MDGGTRRVFAYSRNAAIICRCEVVAWKLSQTCVVACTGVGAGEIHSEIRALDSRVYSHGPISALTFESCLSTICGWRIFILDDLPHGLLWFDEARIREVPNL